MEDNAMPKDMKTVGELERMIAEELGEPSVIINVQPDSAGSWDAKTYSRAQSAKGAEARVKEITQRLRQFYDLKG
jgi:hypothetical protein